MADIHLQSSQLQDNNNGVTRDNVKGVVESRDARIDLSIGPDEMWTPGSAPGSHREVPVDVPDTLLQQAYAKNQVMSLMLNRSETTSFTTSKNRLRSNATINDTRSSASVNENSVNHHDNHHQSNTMSLSVKDNGIAESGRVECVIKSDDANRPRIVEIKVSNKPEEDRHLSLPSPIKLVNENDEKIVTRNRKKGRKEMSPFDITDDEEDIDSPPLCLRNDVSALVQKESSVDADEDYPFAKEDYPTMLKTCSDDSASPRSSSGRSDSTAPLNSSLILPGKESPLYDSKRIDLGSPCRPLVPEIKIAPLFSRGRETTSFDNPAYGLSTDLHDLHDIHQGLLMRSDEVTDLTRLIDEQNLVNGKKPRSNDHLIHQHRQIRNSATPEMTKIKKKKSGRESDIDIEGLIGAGSTDDLLSTDLTNLTITKSVKKKKQPHFSSGYSTLRSDASLGDSFPEQTDRSFLMVGNRSYREVAVDCPADFVPVKKSHPVYPPPNKIDDRSCTLPANLQTEHLAKMTRTFGTNERLNLNKNETMDNSSQGIKFDDVRNDLVNAFGKDDRQDKVRTRVLRHTSHLNLSNTGRIPSKRIINAFTNTARTTHSEASTNSSIIHAYDKSTAHNDIQMTERRVDKSRNSKINVIFNKMNKQPKVRLQVQQDYVNDRIPKGRSTLNLMRRESNQNSHNSLRELIKRRDSTPIIVCYSPKEEKTWLFQENSSCVHNLEDTPKLQNDKNSMLSLEYDSIKSIKRDDSFYKKLVDMSVSSTESKILHPKFKSEGNICSFDKDLSRNDKFNVGSRSCYSEPGLVSANIKVYDSRIERQQNNDFKIRRKMWVSRADVFDDEEPKKQILTALQVKRFVTTF